MRWGVTAVVVIGALSLRGIPCRAAEPTPGAAPSFSLTGGVGNALGWYGAQAERYVADGRASFFGGLGYAYSPDKPPDVSGAIAGAGGCRAFFGGRKHRFYIEGSVSLLLREWTVDESGSMRGGSRYGPGLQVGYQLVSRKGVTLSTSAGVGYAMGAVTESTTTMFGFAVGYTWRRPAPGPVPAPPASTRVLIERLSSKDPAVRARSAWSLADATELEGEARPALKRLRTDDEKDVRYAAEWALTHLRKGKDEPDVAEPQANEGDWTSPKATLSPRPEYPEAAFTSKVEGTVLVEILVGEEGEVAHAEIRQSIPALDEAALAAVRQWKFQPARVDGAPRAAVAQVPVAFRID